jgi:hypothetical protein
MRLYKMVVFALSLVLFTSLAKADTINFTVTITRLDGLNVVPVGTTFSGFVHYDGSIDPNFTGYPPTPTSYAFDFPSAPDSLSDLKWAFIQRHYIGGPLWVGLAYVDDSNPAESFILTAESFAIVLPTNVDANGIGWSLGEYGSVAYSYVADPPPTPAVPEPASLLLVASGLLGAAGLYRQRA